MPEPQAEHSAAGPVHDERQQDDGQDYYDHPEEQHDDAGDGIPRYGSRSSHGRQLPTDAHLIRTGCGGLSTIQHMASPDAGLPGNIGAPATRALTAAGYTQLSQLANVPAAELKKLHGVGPKALRLLQEALEGHGMSLG